MPAIHINGSKSSRLTPAVRAIIPNCNQEFLLSGTRMITVNLADLPHKLIINK
jgi:hypothetical protein